MTPLEVEQLIEDVSAERFGRENLGFTDFLSAFDVAQDMFRTAPQPAIGKIYQNVIIIITDGAPCVPEEDGLTNCLNLESAGSFEHLQELAQSAARYFPNTPIYTIVFDAPNDNFDFWSLTQQDWRNVVCANLTTCDPDKQVTLSQNSQDLVVQLLDIFNTLLVRVNPGIITETLQLNVPFEVPPYLQMIRITVVKNQAIPINIEFETPLGTNPLSTVGGTSRLIQTYRFDLPPSGRWILRSSDANMLAQPPVIDFVALSFAVNGSITPIAIPQFSTFTANIQIADRANLNRLIEINPTYPVSVALQLYDARNPVQANRPPVGAAIPVNLTLGNTGLLDYTVTLFADVTGKFEARVTADYEFRGQRNFISFDQTIGQEFEILPSYVDWRGVIENTTTRAGVPVALRAEVLQSGNDVPVSITQGQLMFLVTVTRPDGTVVLEDIPLAGTPLASGQPLPQPSTRLNDIVLNNELAPGDYQVRASLYWRADETTPFEQWFKLSDSPTTNLTIRPIVPLQVRVTLPTEPTSEVQPPFADYLGITPVRVQVEISTVDETGVIGQPVSLGSLTAGQENAPTLTITPQNGTAFTVPLSENLTGVYTASLPDLREGEYTFTATINTGNAGLIGDYQWLSQTATITHNRITAGYVIPTLLGFLLALVIAIIAAILLIKFLRDRRVAPLNTKVKITVYNNGVMESESPVFTLSKVNTITLRKGLPSPLTRVVLTTKGETEASKNSQFYIMDVAAGRTSLKSDLPSGTVLPLNVITIYQSNKNNNYVEYRLENLGEEDFMGGSAVFNDNSTEPAFTGLN